MTGRKPKLVLGSFGPALFVLVVDLTLGFFALGAAFALALALAFTCFAAVLALGLAALLLFTCFVAISSFHFNDDFAAG
jgi:hypothetical protein